MNIKKKTIFNKMKGFKFPEIYCSTERAFLTV